MLAAFPAQAQLLGNEIQGIRYFPDTATVVNGPINATVGAGVEFPNTLITYLTTSADFDIDLTDSSIRIELVSNTDPQSSSQTISFFTADFNGVRLFDVNGTINAITGVSVNAATTVVGFDASRVTFDADNLFFNFQGLTFDTAPNQDLVIVDVAFGGSANAAPEPATVSLVAVGLLPVLGAVIRHRRRKP